MHHPGVASVIAIRGIGGDGGCGAPVLFVEGDFPAQAAHRRNLFAVGSKASGSAWLDVWYRHHRHLFLGELGRLPAVCHVQFAVIRPADGVHFATRAVQATAVERNWRGGRDALRGLRVQHGQRDGRAEQPDDVGFQGLGQGAGVGMQARPYGVARLVLLGVNLEQLPRASLPFLHLHGDAHHVGFGRVIHPSAVDSLREFVERFQSLLDFLDVSGERRFDVLSHLRLQALQDLVA